MYQLEYLPSARQDMIEIAEYVSEKLYQPEIAKQLVSEIVEAGNRIVRFPLANPKLYFARPLRHEYRKLLIRNYLMIYTVDEEKELITVARILYARRDYRRLLE